MKHIIRWKTYDGTETLCIDDSESDSVQKEILSHYDSRIADITGVFLRQYEHMHRRGVDSVEKLRAVEQEYIDTVKKRCDSHNIVWDNDAFSKEAVSQKFSYLWLSTGYIMEQLNDYSVINFFLRMKRTAGSEELLFWSFRLCAWAEFDNHLPYTLYRCLIDKRLERFYDSHPELRSEFLCTGSREDDRDDLPDEGLEEE